MKRLIVFCSLVLALFGASQVFAACAANTIPTAAKEDFLKGTFATSHTYKIAFYTSSATFDATSTTYSATNEVSGTGYSAGGYIIADNGSTKPAPTTGNGSSTGYLTFTDLAPTGVTFSAAAACAVIYDTSASNKIIYSSSITSVQPSNGTLTIDFPSSGSGTSLIRIQ